jgi:cytochrome P450
MTTASTAREGTFHRRHAAAGRLIPHASPLDTIAAVSGILAPTIAKGVIIRRRGILAGAQMLDLDLRAIRTMQRLRRKYGRGPLMLRTPLRRQALILDPEHIRRVLDGSPEPFATASMEKRAALSHFEPRGALISHGTDRAERRRLNEEALENGNPMHSLAPTFVGAARRHAETMLSEIPGGGILAWDHFAEHWFRMVREVVFGPAAADDVELRELIDTLRARANWAFLAPKRRDTRKYFLARLQDYLQRAEPGSLAAMIAQIPRSPGAHPEHQVPQWMFAFDPAGMTTFRALALLASSPGHLRRAREEAGSLDAAHEPLGFLRASALEALRLWPTTPLVLRETTEEVEFDGRRMPARTHIIIFAPYFHRDDTRLAYAHRFAPEIWPDDLGPRDWPLIPFSRGPAVCPGRHLVLLLSSAFNATLLRARPVRLAFPTHLRPEGPLPATLSHFTIRFEIG